MSISIGNWRDIYSVAFPILGLVVLLFGIWWTRPNKTKKDTAIIQDRIEQQYSAEHIDKLDKLITQGEALASQMQRPDFHTGQMGQDVRQWLDSTDRDVWQVIPEYASYIVAQQGDFTHDEKLRYEGWKMENVTLRISVDRRLSRLREIRSKIQTSDLETECKEALQHIVVEERSHADLTLLRAYAGYPVNYPIRIRNCRPHSLEFIGYNATILWDGAVVHRVEWRAPSAEASNSLLVHPPVKGVNALPYLKIPPDDWYQVDIPVNMVQIPNLPKESPMWNVRGVLMFRCGKQTREIVYDLKTDNYQFPRKIWEEIRNHILRDGN